MSTHVLVNSRPDGLSFARVLSNLSPSSFDASTHVSPDLSRMQERISDTLINTMTSTPVEEQSAINEHQFSHINLNPPKDEEASSTPVAQSAPVKLRNRKYCKNYCYGISFVPILGTIPSITCQCILTGRLKKATDSEQMVKLLTRINQYKVASIVRTVLTLAAIIAVLAFGILTGGIALGLGIGLVSAVAIFGLGLTAFHLIQLQTNKSEIKELLQTPKEPAEETTPTPQI